MTNSQVGKELNTNEAFSPEVSSTTTSISGIFKFFVYSLIGMIVFFVPITLNGKSSIILDHIVSGIIGLSSKAVTFYALLVLALGAIYPFITKTWNNGAVNTIFSIFKVFGLLFGAMIVLNIGPG